MLYSAFHRIEPVAEHRRARTILCDVVGPLCESSDTLGKDRRCRGRRSAICMAVLDAGAYGAVMASNYNRRPMPAEVIVDGAVVGDSPPPDDRRSARAGNAEDALDSILVLGARLPDP